MAANRMPGLATGVLLLIALGGPELFALTNHFLLGERPRLPLQIINHIFYCGLAVIVLWGVVHWEHLPLQSIGLHRPNWTTAATALLAIAIGLIVQVFVIPPLLRLVGTRGMDAGLRQIAAWPVWFRIIVGITGGAVEEILYRGFAIERLAMIAGGRWRGAAIALVVFTLAHIPAWGVGFALTADLLAGVILTLLFLWRRDLLANILAHSTGLVIGLLTVAH